MNAPYRPEAFTDPDEAHEAAREEATEEFNEWRGRDWRNREDADIGEWLSRMAQPHMRDHEKYALAMTWAERGPLSDSELVGLSKGHRQFNRENRRVGGSR